MWGWDDTIFTIAVVLLAAMILIAALGWRDPQARKEAALRTAHTRRHFGFAAKDRQMSAANRNDDLGSVGHRDPRDPNNYRDTPWDTPWSD